MAAKWNDLPERDFAYTQGNEILVHVAVHSVSP